MAGSKRPIPTVYWMPGCSSCLRMKEFVATSGVAVQLVNIAENPDEGRALIKRGINPPAVARGDDIVNGNDFVEVARVLGFSYEKSDMLAPAELVERYLAIAAGLNELSRHLDGALGDYAPPGRDRTLLQLAYHAASVMRIFLHDYDPDAWGQREVYADRMVSGLVDSVTSPSAVRRRLRDTVDLFTEWWTCYGHDDDMTRVISTYWGYHTLHEVFEREVWHTAQHTRQVEHFVAEGGGDEHRVLSEEILSGLPLPAGIHQ